LNDCEFNNDYTKIRKLWKHQLPPKPWLKSVF
jgi:hypothetical protein